MALQWLGRGYEEHSSNMVFLAIDPPWDGDALRPALRRPAAPDEAAATVIGQTSASHVSLAQR
jgi:hypothetical protein